MSMSTGVSNNSPIANLSISDPRCNNDSCSAFKAAHAASQAAVSYTWQFEYGHWTTWYYIIIIGFFTGIHALRLWRLRCAKGLKDHSKQPNLLDRARACRRSITYRRLHGETFNSLGLPSFGILLFMLATLTLFVVATFAVQPYYREHRGYGSPPLAVRTGLMAVACTPILVALAGKANVITLLTGYGHEKLNVIHRYVAWMCFGLSVVHTIPFIVAPLNDGGYAQLHAQFYKTGSFEYTGVPPLAMRLGLVVFSIPWIRHRFYETFWHLHIFLALAYIGLMFWHAGQEQDSWAYMWATLAVLFSSALARFFYFNRAFNVRNEWFVGSPAALIPLSSGMVRIEVLAPDGFNWRPGQHCYIRLPSLRPWDNHPFTIANAPSSGSMGDDRGDVISFLVRSRAGFTHALNSAASSMPDTTITAWLDGPYGGMRHRIEYAYDKMILIAGGSGISASLPWLQHLALQIVRKDSLIRMGHVTLVWIMRQLEHLSWAEQDILDALSVCGTEYIQVEIFITGDANAATAKTTPVPGDALDEWTVSQSSSTKDDKVQEERKSLLQVNKGRPHLGELLPRMITAGRCMILACGPESLKIDISNACAKAQHRVLSREVKEVKLHTETFGW